MQPCVEPGTTHTRAFLKAQINEAIGCMSAESRWQRFATPLTELSDSQLDYLTNVDGVDRVAWCAAVLEEHGERGIGLARYVKTPEQQGVAEFALTVVDEFQGQGVGYALLKKLMEAARENGLKVLRGYSLPGNRRMLSLCKRIDACVQSEDFSLMTIDIKLD